MGPEWGKCMARVGVIVYLGEGRSGSGYILLLVDLKVGSQVDKHRVSISKKIDVSRKG